MQCACNKISFVLFLLLSNDTDDIKYLPLYCCYLHKSLVLLKLSSNDMSFDLLFRYNTFTPDTVKKMPRADLVEEVKTLISFCQNKWLPKYFLWYCFVIYKNILVYTSRFNLFHISLLFITSRFGDYKLHWVSKQKLQNLARRSMKGFKM